MSKARCFKVDSSDNVATLLDDVDGGNVDVLGDSARSIQVLEPVKLGHKIALRDIANNDAIIKFGVAIGRATAGIRAGQWVHLHNCASNFDQRSQTLDVHTGAVTDMKYE